MEKLPPESQNIISTNFEMEEVRDNIDEAAFFRMLADHIAYLIEYRLEFLLSLMYRLDIEEKLVNEALSPLADLPPNEGLAHLVIERQKKRLFTKRYYKQDQHKDLEGMEWD